MKAFKRMSACLLALMVATICAPLMPANATLPPEVYYAANVAYDQSYDDGAWGPYNIGFDFDFFDSTFTQFFANSNGWVGIYGAGNPLDYTYNNTAIPNASSPNNMICAMWDDLVVHSNGGVIYYQTIGNAPNRKCVIQCTNMGFWSDPTLLGTFSVILYETSNEIQIQYRIIVDNSSSRSHGGEATVGLENYDGTVGVQYSFNTEAIESEQAIRFTPAGGTYTVDDEALFDGILLGDGNAPTIPQLTSPAHAAIAPQQPVFQWQPCDYTNSYEFRISTSSTLSGATVTDVGSATSYTPVSPLTDEQDYYWAVFAVGTDGTTWSEILKFTASDSAPPTANPQTVWTTLGADALVTLGGTGGLSELTASISSLPLNGELYQYDEGRGDQITTAPTEVSDSDNRVLFYVNDGMIGTNRGNFEFTMADTSGWESDPGLVTVNVYPAPAVTTTAPTSTGATTAGSGGNVTDDGGSAVSARGVCWGTAPFPTVANDHTTDGTGTGVYASSLTGLTTGATYYVRAYAQNEDGIAYGGQYSFPAGLPVLTTTMPTGITQSGAISGGTISADGGDVVTARGVCWSTDADPTVADDTTNDGGGTGGYTSAVTGLEQGVSYHLRAYATNANGTNYGADVSFTTSDEAIIHKISGNAGIPFAEMHYLVDDEEIFVLADSVGDYQVSVADGWWGIVEPVLAGYQFDPAMRLYEVLAGDTANQNYAAAPTHPVISGNCGAPGAIVTYGSLANQWVAADEQGDYAFSIWSGWSGTVTPTHDDYIFMPASRSYSDVVEDLSDQDFQGNYLELTISGFILDPQGNGIAGVTLLGLFGEPVTDATGFYSTLVYEGWSGTVTPSKDDYAFAPTAIEYAPMLYDQEGQDFDGFSLSLEVEDGDLTALPTRFELGQNQPNPFNPLTTIRVELPHSAATTLKVYNLVGQEVATLVDQVLPAGYHELSWDGSDQYGREAPTGIYLYRLQADDFVDVKKMLLLK